VPAPVSLLLLVGAAVAWAWFAVSEERGATAEGPRRTLAAALGRDVLTGRPTGPDGVPVTPDEGWGSPQQPIRLRFVPSGDQTNSPAALERLLEFLRRRTGYVVDGAILKSYGHVVEEIRAGLCEVAFLTSASYAHAHHLTARNDDPDDDLVTFLQVVRQGDPAIPGSDLMYRGAIVVRADSDLTDIRRLDAGRTIAMGNRTSSASSVLPTAYLNSLGLKPRIQRYGGYPFILTAVLDGAVDAGCVWWMTPNEDNPENDARILMKASHPDVFTRTRILAYTSWIPNEPVVARKALPEDVRHVLGRALSLYVNRRAMTAEGRRELESIGSVLGFIPARDADFAEILSTVERAFADDPEGWADFTGSGK
jgi:phosphonate transport system substrate-binding protein